MVKTVRKQSAEKCDKGDSDLEKQVAELREKVHQLEMLVSDLMSKQSSSSQIRKATNQFKCRKCVEVYMTKSELQMHVKTNHLQKFNCKECKQCFDKNSDLEYHMTTDHKSEKKFKCEICEKTFILEWRLKKHTTMHVKAESKKCHYYNNGKFRY